MKPRSLDVFDSCARPYKPSQTGPRLVAKTLKWREYHTPQFHSRSRVHNRTEIKLVVQRFPDTVGLTRR